MSMDLIPYSEPHLCPRCRGAGQTADGTCSTCDGTGRKPGPGWQDDWRGGLGPLRLDAYTGPGVADVAHDMMETPAARADPTVAAAFAHLATTQTLLRLTCEPHGSTFVGVHESPAAVASDPDWSSLRTIVVMHQTAAGCDCVSETLAVYVVA